VTGNPQRWVVIVPLRALPDGKSRLRAAVADEAEHARLVGAIRADTLAAAWAAPGVAHVLTLVDRPTPEYPDALHQTVAGLNAAVTQAETTALGQWPGHALAVLVGDLAALKGADLGVTLEAAAGYPRAFVPDAAGTGTTLLTARPGQPLGPLFGLGSAARHAASGAVALAAPPGLRLDVDTADDLRHALALGAGTHTRSVSSAGVIAGMIGE
jgi:2-phospho-L-lactate guanylyltransferase